MTSLAAVLTGHRALPIETVEQAMLRQTLFGGDLATNLLELGAIDETTLLSMVGLSLGLPTAEPGPLPPCTDALRARVPHTLPTQREVFPLPAPPGWLKLAVAERLSDSTVAELSIQTGSQIEQHVALRIRIQQATSRDFGVALDTRATRLLELLDGPRLPSTAPPSAAPPSAAPPSAAPPSAAASPPSRAPSKPPLSVRPVAVRARAAAVLSRSLLPKAARGNPGASTNRRRRGPFTAAMAEGALGQCASAGEALEVWSDFVSQYFESVALFALKNKALTLTRLRGAGEANQPSKFKTVGLDVSGSIAKACEQRNWHLACLGTQGTDQAVADGLGCGTTHKVLLVPVSVRGRVVAMILGDDGARDVELPQVGDVLSFTALVELALERLLVERKRHQKGPERRASGRKTPAPPAPAALVEETSAQLPPVEEASAPLPPVEPLSAPVAELGGFHPESPPTLRTTPDARTHASPPPDPHDGETVRAPEVERIAQAELTQILRDQAQVPAAAAFSTESPVGLESAGAAPGPFGSSVTKPGLISTRPGLMLESPQLPNHAGTKPGLPPAPPTSTNLFATPSSADKTGVKEVYGEECCALVEQLLDGDTSVIPALVELGDLAAGLLSQKLPGPLTPYSRPSRAENTRRASESGPVLRALVALGPVARPHVIARTTDPNASVRSWATRLLGELPGRQSAIAVARRLVQDRHPEVRRAAFAAGQMLGRDTDAGAALRGSLLTTAGDRGTVVTQRLSAIDALSDLRDVAAIPDLVGLLSDTNPGTAAAAQQALVVLTRQDFGFDGSKWLPWYETNRTRPRIEWLIDAVDHDSPTIRQLAAEELHTLSRLYVGDIDDADPEQRRRVQQKYREWYRNTPERASVSPRG